MEEAEKVLKSFKAQSYDLAKWQKAVEAFEGKAVSMKRVKRVKCGTGEFERRMERPPPESLFERSTECRQAVGGLCEVAHGNRGIRPCGSSMP